MKLLVSKCLLVLAGLLTGLAGRAAGADDTNGWFAAQDYAGQSHLLPPGLPRTVDPQGKLLYLDEDFFTTAYDRECSRLMWQAVNRVVTGLDQGEDDPIPVSKALCNYRSFSHAFDTGELGELSTTNYYYRFQVGNHLSEIEMRDVSEEWRALQDELVPVRQLDTNAAYQLAVRWLKTLSVDVDALNRECDLSVNSGPILNHVGSGKKPIRQLFSPTYDVAWKPRQPSSTNIGLHGNPNYSASVQLYLPDQSLLRLTMYDSKYFLSPPITFTNLAGLFPAKAMVATNYPVTPDYVSGGFPAMPTPANFVTDSNQPEPKFHDLPLSRWIQTETKLNPHHLPLAQLVTWQYVSGPDEWGVVTFELPVPYAALNRMQDLRGLTDLTNRPFANGDLRLGELDDEGNFIEYTFHDTTRAPDGNTLVNWNINWQRPGQHAPRARLNYAVGMDGDEINLTGPPISYCCTNSCRFYEDSTLFADNGATLFARLREPAAKFRVIVTGVRGKLINDISSSTTNGDINLDWDLTSLNGTKFTNNSFIASFYVTYPDDTRIHPPVKAQFSKIGTDGEP